MTGRVVVVGAGVAGLSAAYHLAEAGLAVEVLEADGVAGGRLSVRRRLAFEHDGRSFEFPLEHGIHGVWRPYRNLRRLLGRLGTLDTLTPASHQEMIARQRGRRVTPEVGARIRDSRLPSFVAPGALAREPVIRRDVLDAGPRAALRMMRDLGHVLAFDPRFDVEAYDDVPVAAFIDGWPPLIRRLFESLTHQGFFQDADRVSLAAFLTGVAFYVVNDKADTAFDLFGDDPERAIVIPAHRAIEARGGALRLATPAIALEGDQGRVRAVRAVGVGPDGRRFDADAVVLALDPPGLARLLGDRRAEILPDAEIPEGVPSAAARFWYDASPYADRKATGIFADGEADNFFWLDRIQPPFRAWRVATGGAVLECHLYGRRAERAAADEPEAVLARVRRTVADAWPELAGREVKAVLQVNPPTHVAFAPGALRRLPRPDTAWSNLFLAGDWIEPPFPCLYLERATVTGLVAARRAAMALGVDPERVPAPLRPPPPRPSVRVGRRLLRATMARFDRAWARPGGRR